jgi:pyridoxine/pyridoxamine 5'-phosphate oxidase
MAFRLPGPSCSRRPTSVGSPLTNYDSKKGEEIAANPRVTLLFPWFSLERQIHITGSLIKTSEEESLT